MRRDTAHGLPPGTGADQGARGQAAIVAQRHSTSHASAGSRRAPARRTAHATTVEGPSRASLDQLSQTLEGLLRHAWRAAGRGSCRPHQRASSSPCQRWNRPTSSSPRRGYFQALSSRSSSPAREIVAFVNDELDRFLQRRDGVDGRPGFANSEGQRAPQDRRLAFVEQDQIFGDDVAPLAAGRPRASACRPAGTRQLLQLRDLRLRIARQGPVSASGKPLPLAQTTRGRIKFIGRRRRVPHFHRPNAQTSRRITYAACRGGQSLRRTAFRLHGRGVDTIQSPSSSPCSPSRRRRPGQGHLVSASPGTARALLAQPGIVGHQLSSLPAARTFRRKRQTLPRSTIPGRARLLDSLEVAESGPYRKSRHNSSDKRPPTCRR